MAHTYMLLKNGNVVSGQTSSTYSLSSADVHSGGDTSFLNDSSGNPITTHAMMGPISSSLLMTCRVSVDAPDGMMVVARALLDSPPQPHLFQSDWLKAFVSLVHLKMQESQVLLV